MQPPTHLQNAPAAAHADSFAAGRHTSAAGTQAVSERQPRAMLAVLLQSAGLSLKGQQRSPAAHTSLSAAGGVVPSGC
jgi:hypothetical protein